MLETPPRWHATIYFRECSRYFFYMCLWGLYIVAKFQIHSYNTFRDKNYYPLTDGQTDRQKVMHMSIYMYIRMDRKWCIWAICTGGLKNGTNVICSAMQFHVHTSALPIGQSNWMSLAQTHNEQTYQSTDNRLTNWLTRSCHILLLPAMWCMNYLPMNLHEDNRWQRGIQQTEGQIQLLYDYASVFCRIIHGL